MTLIQIILLVVLFCAILMTWKRAREQAITGREAFAWTVLWSGAAFIIFLPQTTTIVAQFFGVGRGVDFVLYASVILLFLGIFRLHVMVERVERKMTELVRAQALKDVRRD